MESHGRATSCDGILLVDKPAGISSARAVALVKKALGGAKVGHLGTLDPFASGLLPLCLGEGTKIAPYLNVADKAYVGTVELGVRTDTLDGTGEVIARAAVPPLASFDWSAVAAEFTGTIEQVPPAFSAIKRAGVRMYELARRGEAPDLEPRTVVIRELTIEVAGPTCLRLAVTCSKGTYIRSLARDLGERLGCGGILATLVRTRFGPFALMAALPLERFAQPEGHNRLEGAFVSLSDALAHLRALHADSGTVARLRAGQQAALATLEAPVGAGEKARVLGPDGRLVAVVADAGTAWRLERVFHGPKPCAL